MNRERGGEEGGGRREGGGGGKGEGERKRLLRSHMYLRNDTSYTHYTNLTKIDRYQANFVGGKKKSFGKSLMYTPNRNLARTASEDRKTSSN